MPRLSIFQILLAGLWTGGAIITGYIAIPIIFMTLKPNTALAGTIAGNILTVIAWVGLGVGLILLATYIAQKKIASIKRRSTLTIICLGLIALNQFFLHPMIIVARAQRAGGDVDAAIRFTWLHGGSQVLFLIVTILSTWLLIHLIRKACPKP